MHLTYRTRRRLQFLMTAGLALLLVFILIWICWVVWLERFVVYTREGATINFTLAEHRQGEVAVEPKADETVPIFFNEGSDAIELTTELTPLYGYYIDYYALRDGMDAIREDLNRLKAGTTIMIELKGAYGSFYYSSKLPNAQYSASVDVAAVDELIKYIHSKGFYMIAQVSAFRDYDFGNRNVTSGLYMNSRAGLWMDGGGYFWLDPTNANTIGWITSVINEVKELGFNEVMLDNFRFPAETDKYIFTGDMEEALREASAKFVSACGSDTFVISFGATTPTFPLPEGRTRVFLTNVEAKDVGARAAQATFENSEARLVFLCDTNDTRFDAYSVLRPLSVSEGIEAQKADMT